MLRLHEGTHIIYIYIYISDECYIPEVEMKTIAMGYSEELQDMSSYSLVLRMAVHVYSYKYGLHMHRRCKLHLMFGLSILVCISLLVSIITFMFSWLILVD